MRMQLPDHAYSTYGIVMPKSTHTRKARCEEVAAKCMSMLLPEGATDPDEFVALRCPEQHCGPHAHGWMTALDTSIPQQRELAKLIIKNDGNRHWTATQDGHLVRFTFPAGQQCFADHRVPLDRPPIFTLKRGREYSSSLPYINGGAIHIPGARNIRGEEWVERLGENQQAIIDAQRRG